MTRPACLLVPSEPERRLALAIWIRSHRKRGDLVIRPPRCIVDVCPRHGSKTMLKPTVLVGYEYIGYGVVSKEARGRVQGLPSPVED